MTKAENGILSLVFDILKRQISISTDFLALLETEKQALIDMNMNSIIELTHRKEDDLAKMAQLDHSLQEVARQVVISDSPSQGKTIKLVELIPFMSREQAVTLKKLRDQLAALREKIADNNLINKRFAGDTLRYINDAISLICSEITNKPAYHPRRKAAGSSPAPALVSKEV